MMTLDEVRSLIQSKDNVFDEKGVVDYINYLPRQLLVDILLYYTKEGGSLWRDAVDHKDEFYLWFLTSISPRGVFLSNGRKKDVFSYIKVSELDTSHFLLKELIDYNIIKTSARLGQKALFNFYQKGSLSKSSLETYYLNKRTKGENLKYKESLELKGEKVLSTNRKVIVQASSLKYKALLVEEVNKILKYKEVRDECGAYFFKKGGASLKFRWEKNALEYKECPKEIRGHSNDMASDRLQDYQVHQLESIVSQFIKHEVSFRDWGNGWQLHIMGNKSFNLSSGVDIVHKSKIMRVLGLALEDVNIGTINLMYNYMDEKNDGMPYEYRAALQKFNLLYKPEEYEYDIRGVLDNYNQVYNLLFLKAEEEGMRYIWESKKEAIKNCQITATYPVGFYSAQIYKTFAQRLSEVSFNSAIKEADIWSSTERIVEVFTEWVRPILGFDKAMLDEAIKGIVSRTEERLSQMKKVEAIEIESMVLEAASFKEVQEGVVKSIKIINGVSYAFDNVVQEVMEKQLDLLYNNIQNNYILEEL